VWLDHFDRAISRLNRARYQLGFGLSTAPGTGTLVRLDHGHFAASLSLDRLAQLLCRPVRRVFDLLVVGHRIEQAIKLPDFHIHLNQLVKNLLTLFF